MADFATSHAAKILETVSYLLPNRHWFVTRPAYFFRAGKIPAAGPWPFWPGGPAAKSGRDRKF